jgi:hypothetical protein
MLVRPFRSHASALSPTMCAAALPMYCRGDVTWIGRRRRAHQSVVAPEDTSPRLKQDETEQDIKEDVRQSFAVVGGAGRSNIFVWSRYS